MTFRRMQAIALQQAKQQAEARARHLENSVQYWGDLVVAEAERITKEAVR